MADVSASPFTFRDFIQLIFPAIIALTLFIPFYDPLGQKVTTAALVFAGIVLGYLTSSASTILANWITGQLPLFKKRLEQHQARGEWLLSNWDLGVLTSYLTKDENDYVDLLSSLWIFHRVTAFYLLAYAAFSVARLVVAVHRQPGFLAAVSRAGLSTSWETLRRHTTPMFGGWTLPTLFVIPVSLLLVVLALRDCLEQYERVFLEGGLYDQYAAKYQRKEKTIARRLWGQVLNGPQPVGGACVRVRRYGAEVANATADESGRFFIERSPEECDGYTIEVYGACTSVPRVIKAESPAIMLAVSTGLDASLRQ